MGAMKESDIALLTTMAVFGLVHIILIGVNSGVFIVHRNTQKTEGSSSRLGKWAWSLSLASLLVVFLLPIVWIMAIVDFRRREAPASKHHLLPTKMALLNSGVSASYFSVLMLAIFVFEWI